MSTKKWLLTNGLGGFCLDIKPDTQDASGHLFYLPLKPPLKTQPVVHHLYDQVSWQGNWVPLFRSDPGEKLWKIDFRQKDGLPHFSCSNPFFTIQKVLFMVPGQNALFIRYSLSETDHTIAIRIRPSIPLNDGVESFKDWRNVQHATVNQTFFNLSENGDKQLNFQCDSSMEIIESRNWIYTDEKSVPALYCPFAYATQLQSDKPVTFRVGLQSDANFNGQSLFKEEQIRRERIRIMAGKNSKSDLIGALAIPASDFLVQFATQKKRKNLALVTQFPHPKIEISAILQNILGLYLCTGNVNLSRDILRGLRQSAVNGVLQPLTDTNSNGLAAMDGLWYCNAVFTHLLVEKDERFMADEYPFLLSVLNAYLQNRVPGCHFDEQDGLLVTDTCANQIKESGLIRWKSAIQAGKRVDVQALFYNALCIILDFASRLKKNDGIRKLQHMHTAFRKNFLKTFWLNEQEYLADFIHNESVDNRFGSAQLLALALPFSALTEKKSRGILEQAKIKLVTTCGVRTLDKSHPAYEGQHLPEKTFEDYYENQGNISIWATKLFVISALKNGEKSNDIIHLFQDLFNETVKNGDRYFSENRAGDPPHNTIDNCASAVALASLIEMVYALRADEAFASKPS